MTCPETDCREDLIQRINEKADTIKNGIKTELKDTKAQCADKVGVKSFYWIVAGFLTAIAIVSGLTYTAYSKGQDQKQSAIEETQKATKQLDKNMAVMAKDIEHIKEHAPTYPHLDTHMEHKCDQCGEDFEFELEVMSPDFFVLSRT